MTQKLKWKRNLSANDTKIREVKTKDEKVEKVDKHRYLGSMLTGHWRNKTKINTMTIMAKKAFIIRRGVCFLVLWSRF